ncbi:hypothetical protein Tco_1078089 [Tanacetum coccineum]
MDITRDQQLALDDALVAPANRLKIGKSNLRLSSDLNSKEATLQVVYDVLKLTPFYKAFQITTDVPEIYMQEEMLQICPKLHDRQFEELPFEEEILTFLRDLGHSGEIKCLSGKSTGYDSLRLSQAQILWGMYHKKNVDYAYLLWEDFVYQVENKNVKRSNEMYYPRFTKVIVNFFMTKDQSIPRRNKVNWHFARDDYMFTMIKVVSRHKDTQLYGAILPDELTNEAIKDSESYKEYYAIASGAEQPKTKASVKKKQVGSDKSKTPPTAKGKRLKTSAKATKTAKKKQPAKTSKAKGLTVLSEVALTEAEQMKLATKRSLIETHNSYASGSGADEGTGSKPGVPDVPTYGSNDEQISWKSNDDHKDDGQNDEDQDDVNEHTDSDNNGDDFVHPKLSTHDQEVRHNKEESDEESDEEIQGANVEEKELDEEAINDEDKANKLYMDVNVNLEGRDIEMTDAQQTNVQTTKVIEDTHVIITPVNPEGQQQSSSMSSGFVSNTLNPSPDTGIDSIFNLNTKSTSLIYVSVTTIAEPPLLSTTTLPPPPTPLITHLQQTPVPTPTIVPSSSLQYLPNFGSLFGFDHRLKTLETTFSEFKQMNQFAATVSSILGIVDADEAQAENADFINKLDDNNKKIIKDHVKEQVKAQVSKILPKIEKTVNEQIEVEVLTRSSNESKTSHAVAANLSELELKKILIDKMENEKDKDEEPSAGSNRGSKRRRFGKEPESTSAPKEKTSKTTGKSTEGSKSHYKSTGESAQAEEPMHTAKDLEEPAHQ